MEEYYVFLNKKLSTLSKDLEEKEMKTETETETDQRCADVKQRSAEQRLPSFISHPNGIVLCVFNSHGANTVVGRHIKGVLFKKYDISPKKSRHTTSFWQNFELYPKLSSRLFVPCVFIKYSNSERDQCPLNWHLGRRAHGNVTKNGQKSQKSCLNSYLISTTCLARRLLYKIRLKFYFSTLKIQNDAFYSHCLTLQERLFFFWFYVPSWHHTVKQYDVIQYLSSCSCLCLLPK